MSTEPTQIKRPHLWQALLDHKYEQQDRIGLLDRMLTWRSAPQGFDFWSEQNRREIILPYVRGILQNIWDRYNAGDGTVVLYREYGNPSVEDYFIVPKKK